MRGECGMTRKRESDMRDGKAAPKEKGAPRRRGRDAGGWKPTGWRRAPGALIFAIALFVLVFALVMGAWWLAFAAFDVVGVGVSLVVAWLAISTVHIAQQWERIVGVAVRPVQPRVGPGLGVHVPHCGALRPVGGHAHALGALRREGDPDGRPSSRSTSTLCCTGWCGTPRRRAWKSTTTAWAGGPVWPRRRRCATRSAARAWPRSPSAATSWTRS